MKQGTKVVSKPRKMTMKVSMKPKKTMKATMQRVYKKK